jgi:hypothetical protein
VGVNWDAIAEYVDWRRFGERMVDKIVSSVSYVCRGLGAGCYESYTGRPLRDLAREFLLKEVGVSPEDLELLRRMPKDVYEEYNALLQRALRRLAEHEARMGRQIRQAV